MTTNFIFLAAMSLTIASAPRAFAAGADVELFHRLVNVERDASGKLDQLTVKKTVTEDSATSHVVASLQRDMLGASATLALNDMELHQMMMEGWTQDDIQAFNQASAKIASGQEMQVFLNNKDLQKILVDFEADMNRIFTYNVLAKPNVANYFDDYSLTNLALQKALSAAEKALGNVPGLNIFEFLLNQTLGEIAEKRSYVQSAVLYFLEKTPATDLGLTTDEVALIKSSIYESRLSWKDILNQRDAAKHWKTYGTAIFDGQVASGVKRLKQYGPSYGQVHPSLNFAFTPAEDQNTSLILNTVTKRSKLSSDLSIAYDSSAPGHIKAVRVQLRLTQFALNFVSMPGLLRRQVNSLLNSYYAKQIDAEGSLFAALVSNGYSAEADVVLQQSLNPFLTEELH